MNTAIMFARALENGRRLTASRFLLDIDDGIRSTGMSFVQNSGPTGRQIQTRLDNGEGTIALDIARNWRPTTELTLFLTLRFARELARRTEPLQREAQTGRLTTCEQPPESFSRDMRGGLRIEKSGLNSTAAMPRGEARIIAGRTRRNSGKRDSLFSGTVAGFVGGT